MTSKFTGGRTRSIVLTVGLTEGQFRARLCDYFLLVVQCRSCHHRRQPVTYSVLQASISSYQCQLTLGFVDVRFFILGTFSANRFFLVNSLQNAIASIEMASNKRHHHIALFPVFFQKQITNKAENYFTINC